MNIKTPSDLKYYYELHQNRYFFTRSSMKFFGDTMANFRVVEHESCYELARKKAVLFNNKSSHYFSKIDFRVHPKKEIFDIDKIAAVELKNYITNQRDDLDTINRGDVMTMAAWYVQEYCSSGDTVDMIFNVETIAYTCELLGVK